MSVANQQPLEAMIAHPISPQAKYQPPSGPRKRSSSKTQTNYNPINNTPIASLSTSAPPTIEENPVQELQKYVHVVKLSAPGSSPSEYLKILSIPLAPESLKIGRQNTPKATNKITDGFFDSRVLSRNHAELYIKNNLLYIKDLKSSNGTFINDDKLEPFREYQLKIGDKIDLGTTLESQVAHKKITCIVSEFNYASLEDYESEISLVLSEGDLKSKKLELFNSSLDALIFGELIEEQEDNFLSDLLNGVSLTEEKGELKKDTKFVPGLTVRQSNNMQDIIRKLVITTNNEYLQQQRLKQISRFLKNYNKVLTKSSTHSLSFRELESQPKLLDAQDNRVDNTEKMLKWKAQAAKSDERLRRMEAELNMIRGHLSTARSKESEADRISEENSRLKSRLERRKRDISDLTEKLEDANKTIEKLRHLEAEFLTIQDSNKQLMKDLTEVKEKELETNTLLKSFSEREMLKSIKLERENTVNEEDNDTNDVSDTNEKEPENVPIANGKFKQHTDETKVVLPKKNGSSSHNKKGSKGKLTELKNGELKEPSNKSSSLVDQASDADFTTNTTKVSTPTRKIKPPSPPTTSNKKKGVIIPIGVSIFLINIFAFALYYNKNELFPLLQDFKDKYTA